MSPLLEHLPSSGVESVQRPVWKISWRSDTDVAQKYSKGAQGQKYVADVNSGQNRLIVAKASLLCLRESEELQVRRDSADIAAVLAIGALIPSN